jgi:hypothetical protein
MIQRKEDPNMCFKGTRCSVNRERQEAAVPGSRGRASEKPGPDLRAARVKTACKMAAGENII